MAQNLIPPAMDDEDDSDEQPSTSDLYKTLSQKALARAAASQKVADQSQVSPQDISDAQQSARMRDLIASFAHASSMAGSINGQTASAAPVSQAAQSLNTSDMSGLKQMQALNQNATEEQRKYLASAAQYEKEPYETAQLKQRTQLGAQQLQEHQAAMAHLDAHLNAADTALFNSAQVKKVLGNVDTKNLTYRDLQNSPTLSMIHERFSPTYDKPHYGVGINPETGLSENYVMAGGEQHFMGARGGAMKSYTDDSGAHYLITPGGKLIRPQGADSTQSQTPLTQGTTQASLAPDSGHQVADLGNAYPEGSPKAIARQQRLSDSATKRLDTLNHHLTEETQSSRSTIGRASNGVYSAQKIDALLQQADKQGGAVTPQQLAEIARSLDNMISGGSSTVSGMEHLLPDTAKGRYSNAMSFIQSKPEPVELKEFLNLARDTTNRELDVSKHVIKDYKTKIRSSYDDLAQTAPEAYNRVLKAHGLLDDDSVKSKTTSNSFDMIQNELNARQQQPQDGGIGASGSVGGH